MAIEIEKNIPVPNRKGKSEITRAALSCEIGDSFQFDAKNHNVARSRFHKEYLGDRKFSLSSISEGKFRAWRVK